MTAPKVYILIVNWNGWRHTLECLESVFHSTYHNYAVVLCDNGSEDGSMEYLKSWAQGELQFALPEDNQLHSLSYPPVAKPISFQYYERATAEGGGYPNVPEVPLVLIQTGANLGFGGGNNVGLRYILARDDADYVWLLNNDTVIEPDALKHLVTRAKSDPLTGAVGSKLLDYSRPNVISSKGGKKLSRSLGVVYSNSKGKPDNGWFEANPAPDYIEGASCLIPENVLKHVGLFDTNYFHFWEDVDLSRRILQTGFKLMYEGRSRVYHKEKISLEGNSPKADYLEFLAGVIFYRKHFPRPVLLLSNTIKFFCKAINRIKRRQFDRIPLLYRAFCDGMKQKLND